jgi:hypothetical protein
MNLNFTTYRGTVRKQSDEKPFVTIQKPGNIIFPKSTLRHFGLIGKKGFFIRMYEDIDKRAFGFVIIDRTDGLEKKKNIRFIKIRKVEKKYSYETASTSIASYLSRLGDVKIPSRRLFIEKHSDLLFSEDILYFVIPKDKTSI